MSYFQAEHAIAVFNLYPLSFSAEEPWMACLKIPELSQDGKILDPPKSLCMTEKETVLFQATVA